MQAKEARLLDLDESGDITKQTYRARVAEYKAEIEKHDVERQRLPERLGECAILTPEQEQTLQHFQHDIVSRMTDDVPAADRMQLYDLLRVQCVYNSDTKELLISGLFGERVLNLTSGCQIAQMIMTRRVVDCAVSSSVPACYIPESKKLATTDASS